MKVLFDVDNTVYRQVVPFQNAYNKVLLNYKIEDMEQLFLRSKYHGDQIFSYQQAGGCSVYESGLYRIKHAMKDFGYTITEEEAIAFQDAYVYYQKHLTLLPEMIEVFQYLKKQEIEIGIITNGAYEHQYKKIEVLNLKQWVKETNIFISGAVGYDKPDKRLFSYVEEKMNLKKEDTLYIGDSYEHDVIGAKNAGWKVIWINTHNLSINENEVTKADEEIHDYNELLSKVRIYIEKTIRG